MSRVAGHFRSGEFTFRRGSLHRIAQRRLTRTRTRTLTRTPILTLILTLTLTP